jgi:hypothetical protein
MAILTRTPLVASLLLASSGCERAPTNVDVTAHSITVHAVLSAGSDTATVLVTRPSPQRKAHQPSGTLPVKNAHVRLVHGADTVVLSSTRSCWSNVGEVTAAGCYAAHVPGGIRAAATYELLVNIRGEEPIHGSTRVPPPPLILEPAESAAPPVLRMTPPTVLTARWSGADADSRTELRFAADRADCTAFIARPDGDAGFLHIAVTGPDTATVIAAVHCGQPPADSYAARFVVTVYDDSYTRYAERLGESSQPSRTSVGLTGAFGVFGAAASSATPVVLTMQ